MSNSIQYLNPDGLSRNPAFTQAVVVTGKARTIYVGGQNAVNADGSIVGIGDLGAQAEKALRNLEIALAAAGAGLENVVKWNIYILQGQPIQAGFAAFQKVWGTRPNPPAITGVFVAGLARPDLLVEIDAVAVVSERTGKNPASS